MFDLENDVLALTIALIVPCTITVGLVLLLRRFADRWGLVDRPGGRKGHEGSVPLVGGIAMAGASSVMMLWHPMVGATHLGGLVGLLILVALGLVDDIRAVSPIGKLAWQGLAATVIVLLGGDSVQHLGVLFGTEPIELGWLSVPFTVFAIVGLVNAVNMADGVDGLAGGFVAGSVVWMWVLAAVVGMELLALELVALMGAVVGFLFFNLRTPFRGTAAVFMGDAGSLLLGGCLAWFALRLAQGSAATGEEPAPVVLLWVLGLPVLDTLVVMSRRIREGRSPFCPGRDHVHHRLLEAGLSVSQTIVLLMVVNLMMGALGVLGWLLGLPEWALFVGYCGALGLHWGVQTYHWRPEEDISLDRPLA